MGKIKLLKIDELENGAIRLQSQLLVGQNVADYILEDGVLKRYEKGENGQGSFENDM